MIATISLLAIFLIYNVFFPHAESWKVEKFQIGTDSYSEAFIGLAEDQILKSNRNIRFQIQVSQIGKLFMEPNSKIQRLKNNSIRLFYGSLSAYKINAKQLLTVSVPGAEIKDYFPGGEYKVTTRGQKNSFLEVIDGWVIVKKDNIELIVLPYHDCVIKADSGIGLPFLKSSEEEFIEAIDTYCYTHPGNEEALISVLTKAKLSNSVTLWNLLNRVTRQQRGMVINTIFGLLGGPLLGVTADGLRILDSEMLKKLIKTIESNI